MGHKNFVKEKVVEKELLCCSIVFLQEVPCIHKHMDILQSGL